VHARKATEEELAREENNGEKGGRLLPAHYDEKKRYWEREERKQLKLASAPRGTRVGGGTRYSYALSKKVGMTPPYSFAKREKDCSVQEEEKKEGNSVYRNEKAKVRAHKGRHGDRTIIPLKRFNRYV